MFVSFVVARDPARPRPEDRAYRTRHKSPRTCAGKEREQKDADSDCDHASCTTKVRLRKQYAIVRTEQPAVLCLSLNRQLNNPVSVRSPIQLSVEGWNEPFTLVSVVHHVNTNHHKAAVRFATDQYVMYDSHPRATGGTLHLLEATVERNVTYYPFDTKTAVACLYVKSNQMPRPRRATPLTGVVRQQLLRQRGSPRDGGVGFVVRHRASK